jgi:hypothetical protein
MNSHRPQNRSRSFVLALALGLVATGHAGIAQPSEAPPGPSLELALVTSEWLKPDLVLVSFELRNNGTEPVVVAQRPGVSLGVSCPIGDGVAGIIGGSVASVACGPDRPEHGTFLELRPGEAFLGEKVVRAPKGCTGDVTVMGQFAALSAKGWDLPAHQTVISSSPINVGSPEDPEADSPEDDEADSPQ